MSGFFIGKILTTITGIQLTVTDTLQNFTNDYIFQTQDDMVAAVSMLLDFADYSKESIKNQVLQLQVRSTEPLDTSKSYYHFKKKGLNYHETGH